MTRCDKARGGRPLRMSHTPFVQCMLWCCAAELGLLVYFVNVDVNQLDHAAVTDMSIPVINTFDHLLSPWADIECATTVCSGNITVREMTC